MTVETQNRWGQWPGAAFIKFAGGRFRSPLWLLCACVSAVLLPIESAGQDARWHVVDDSSSFRFEVTHLGLMDVQGTLSGATGEVVFDASGHVPVQASITLDAASFSTGNAERDEEVRSDEFLDVKRYPEIRFESDTFSATHATGTMTISGTSNTVEVPYTLHLEEGDDGVSAYIIESAFVLSRSDYALEFGRILDAMVGDEVAVSVRLLLENNNQ